MLGKNQRLEALATATSREEALPKAFGIGFGFGIFLASFVHGGIGQAEHHPSDHPQDQRRTGRPHPAEVFLHTHVEAVVQSALNDPVLAFELEQAQSLQLLQGLTADEIDDFTRPLAVALDAGLQPGNQSSPRPSYSAGSHFQALEIADFQPAPIVLPAQHPVGRRG
jgi:hypothetical protein